MHSNRNSISSMLSAAISRRLKAGAALAAGLLLTSQAPYAHEVVDGNEDIANVMLNANAWIVLRAFNVVIADPRPHNCAVTAAADVNAPLNPNGSDSYVFTLTENQSSPAVGAPQERTVEFNHNANVFEPSIKSVATTMAFRNLTDNNGLGGGGNHIFRLLGRKLGAANTIVDDSSLTVVCVPSD